MKEEFKLMKKTVYGILWNYLKNGINLCVSVSLRLRMSLMVLSKITRSDLLSKVLFRKMEIDYEVFFY